MKNIVLLSHCILNSMCETPPAPDTYRREITDLFIDRGISMIQLPCPELCYQDLVRESIEPGSEKAEEYAEYCRQLLAPLVDNLQKYKKNGIEVAGIIGIDTSPSCSTVDSDSIMIKVLLEEIEAFSSSRPVMMDMPVEPGHADFIQKLSEAFA